MTVSVGAGRLTLLMLVVAALVAGLATPGQAGTEALPEVTDPANDHVLAGGQSANPGGAVIVNSNADLRAAWVSNETATTINVTMKTTGNIGGGFVGPQSTFVFRYTFSFKVGATTYQAIANIQSTGGTARVDTYTPGGVADQLRVQGPQAILRIPLAAIGNPAAGTAMTEIFAASEARAGSFTGQVATSDRAPNGAAFGLDYVFTMGGGGGGPLAGLTHFLNVTTPIFNETVSLTDASSDVYQYNWTQGPTNATGSFSATGNGSVGFVITDANGTELVNRTTTAPETANLTIPAGMPGAWTVRYTLYNFTGNFTLRIAPDLGDVTGGGGAGTGTGTSTATGTGTGTATGSRTSTGTGGTDGSGSGGTPANLDEAIELIKGDAGYLVFSGAGLLSVLILSIVGLAARWRV